MTPESYAFTGAAVLVVGAVWRRARPLLQLQRAVVLLRAAGYFTALCAEACFAQRWQWRLCLQRARRES